MVKQPELQQDGSVARGSRASDPRPRRPTAGSKIGESSMFQLYLQEMGVTPLLDQENEARLASRLEDARVAIAQLAQALPEKCRKIVLAGDESGPQLGAAWPLNNLATFVRKLVHHAAQRPEPSVAAALREIRAHEAALNDARDGLILANLRLVVHIAKKYAHSGMPLLDLIQEGNFGLLRAVEKFEHQRGNKFATYAFWWIKQGVERGIAEKARTIRIPVHVNEKVRKVEFAARDLSKRLGRKATPREIATKLNVPLVMVDKVLSVVQEPLPLEISPGDDENRTSARFVPDSVTPSPYHLVSQLEIRQRVEAALRGLDPREQAIIRMRFGIGDEVTKTLQQIGKRLRISRERVRQIEWRALAKLKAHPLGRELGELFGVSSTAGFRNPPSD